MPERSKRSSAAKTDSGTADGIIVVQNRGRRRTDLFLQILSAFELRLIQFRIYAAEADQFAVLASFYYMAVLYDQYLVSCEYGRKPVRNEYAGARFYYRVDGFLNLAFGYRIQRSRSFVEDQQCRVLEQHSCDGKTLLFASGELKAAVSYFRIKALLKPFYKIVDIGLFAGFY